MKKFTKLAALMLSLLMMVAMLAACGGDSSSGSTATSGATSSEASSSSVDGGTEDGNSGLPSTWPEETIKIGFVTYDTTADLFLEIQRYYEYLSEFFNIEIMYSESLDSAEGELAFIESAAAAGCKAIIGYYNVARAEAVQLAIDKGMYYYGVAEEDDVYETFKDNDMYLGGYYNENMDYESGYTIGSKLIEAGATRLVYASGGRDFGIQMFMDRSEGFYAAVEDAVADGKDVEVVYDVSGWPGTDAFSSEQTTALDTDVDGIACSFGIGVWLQPVANSGKDNIKLAAVDALSETYFDAWDNGLIAAFSVETAEIFGLAVPLIVNAVDGNLIRDENGQAPRVQVERLVIDNASDFHSYYEIESDGTWILNYEDLSTLIVALNPDVQYADFSALYLAQSVDEVMARRDAQGK